MDAMRRRVWLDALRSVLIAVGISLPMSVPFQRQANLPVWLMGLYFGVPFGLGVVAVQVTGLRRIRHRSFLVTTLARSAVMGAVLLVCFAVSLTLTIATSAGLAPWDGRVTGTVGRVIFSPGLLLAASVALLISAFTTSVFAVSRKLGPGVMWNWFRGYYHEPREEMRFFLFLDMRDSTTLAERLGHLRFSALVRDFMGDLTRPVLETRGEVSHYIGDEAVLTWRQNRGEGAVRLFFLMRQEIARNAGRYRERYGLVPDFKAGLHYGPVVATEVGELKSEIVYHGDVLNTAARIQGLCAAEDEPFLASAEALRHAATPPGVQVIEIGQRHLKGKEGTTMIVALRPSPDA